jgi:hypothetical protein
MASPVAPHCRRHVPINMRSKPDTAGNGRARCKAPGASCPPGCMCVDKHMPQYLTVQGAAGDCLRRWPPHRCRIRRRRGACLVRVGRKQQNHYALRTTRLLTRQTTNPPFFPGDAALKAPLHVTVAVSPRPWLSHTLTKMLASACRTLLARGLPAVKASPLTAPALCAAAQRLTYQETSRVFTSSTVREVSVVAAAAAAEPLAALPHPFPLLLLPCSLLPS